VVGENRMKIMAKVAAVTVLCILIGLPLIYSLTLYSTAWYQRWKSERLLAAVKNLRVGVATRAEYERAVQPFVNDTDRIRIGDTNRPLQGAYGIATLPEWMFMSTIHLPAPIELILGKWSVVEGTLFCVVPTFTDGRLTSIKISEAQGSGHPFGGFVTIHAGQVQHLFPDDTQVFSGYSGHPMGTDERVIYTYVDMDDRATPEERRRALDFRFTCFTSFRPCSDGRQLLDPITTDN
jgi:hypothetical protein